MSDPTSRTGKPSSVGVLWPIAAIAVAIVAMVTGGDAPLISSRPYGAQKSTASSPPFAAAIRGTNAHLWEDPLAAAGRIEWPRDLATRAAVTRILTSLFEDLDDKRDFLVMPVLTPGGPYAADKEERVRNRYAVLSALGSMGYRLSFPQRMSAVTVPILVDLGKQKKVVLRKMCIPIKLYGTDVQSERQAERQASAKYVLLLWINEMKLGDKPLQTLAQILKMLFPLAEDIAAEAAQSRNSQHASSSRSENSNLCGKPLAGRPRDKDKLSLGIVGPANSATLLAMINENSRWHLDSQPGGRGAGQGTTAAPRYDDASLDADWIRPPCDWFTSKGRHANGGKKSSMAAHVQSSKSIYQGFFDPTVYSPRATIYFPSLNLLHNPNLQNIGLKLVQVVGSDLQIMQAVARELRLRGVLPESQRSRRHVVLVTERDTLYGRLLPHTFREVLDVTAEQNLHVFTYFAGIDGKLPGTDNKEERSPRQLDEKDGELLDFLELPEGTSQRDYLRRLAHEIVRLDVQLRHRGKGRVSAIGVVGSDIFDKLLVLRALRNRFPRACFFTTDLDARYATPNEYAYTRNLIVASHFGLTLNRSLRFDVPPFRDSYQTSTFFAALRAVHSIRLERLLVERSLDDPWGRLHRRNPAERELDSDPLAPLEQEKGFLEPMVFEIGRTGAFQLSVPKSPVSTRVQPTSDRETRWLMWCTELFFALVAVCLLVYCLTFYFSPVRRTVRRLRIFSRRLFRRPQRPGPRQQAFGRYVRYISLGLLVTLLLFAVMIIDNARDGGEPIVFASGISVWPSVCLRYAAILWVLVLLVSWTRSWRQNLDVLTKDYGPPVQGQRAGQRRFSARLSRYASTTCFRHRMKRVFFQAFAFYALTWCIYLTADSIPGIPYRGSISKYVTVIVTQSAYGALLFSVFYVLDAVRQCHFFMNRLAREDLDLTGGRQGQRRNIRGNYRKMLLNEAFKVQWIASHTRIIGRMVIYPFLIALLLAATRLSFLDNWDLPLPLFIVVCSALFGLLVGGFLLRRDAQKARLVILNRLGDSMFDSLTDRRKESYVTLAKRAMADIENERGGAFRPLSEDPVLAAVFIPFGGTGTLILFERLLHLV